MSFEALLDKVHQAEVALESSERKTAGEWRQCKTTWLSLWTPGRLVSVGLVSGFLVGAVEPAKRAARGSGALQLLSAVAGLFAGGSAQAAAGQAQDAADSAQQTAATTAPDAGAAIADSAATSVPPRAPATPESLRNAGLL